MEALETWKEVFPEGEEGSGKNIGSIKRKRDLGQSPSPKRVPSEINLCSVHYSSLILTKLFLSFRAILYLACVTNMKEKENSGWILGKDGLYRVNPKWKNVEESLLKNSSEELVNMKKEEMGPLVREGEKMGIGQLAVQRGVKMNTEMCEDKKLAQKKKKFGQLGPRGLKKNGGYNYGGLAASNYSGEDQRVGSLALVERCMKQEGYGVFPKDFEPPLFESKKTFQYVRQDTYTTETLDCYKLALSGVGVEKPKISILNPFSQEMPCGKSQPLPR